LKISTNGILYGSGASGQNFTLDVEDNIYTTYYWGQDYPTYIEISLLDFWSPGGAKHNIAGANPVLFADYGAAYFTPIQASYAYIGPSIDHPSVASDGTVFFDLYGSIYLTLKVFADGMLGRFNVTKSPERSFIAGIDNDDRIYMHNYNHLFYYPDLSVPETITVHDRLGVKKTLITSTFGFGGDGGPAENATFDGIGRVRFDYAGNIYIHDKDNNRIRRLTPTWEELPSEKKRVELSNTIQSPSSDGSELYVFTRDGRHISTLNPLTGSKTFDFGYNLDGLLTSVTDGDGEVTMINRDGSGNATSIVSPYGQTTTLEYDSNGYLASIADPMWLTHKMTYTADGLLTSFAKPNGVASAMGWNGMGRVTSDTNAEGGGWSVGRAGDQFHPAVTMSSAEGRSFSYNTEYPPDGSQRAVNTGPNGLKTETIFETNGGRKVTTPDGTMTITKMGPDPRFGMRAPIVTSSATTLPSGLTSTATFSRSATLANPFDLATLSTMTDTVTVNGKAATTSYDAATRTITSTSPMGRASATTVDTHGRPVRVSAPGVDDVTYAYDAKGRLTNTEQNGRSAYYYYDTTGRLASVKDAIGRSASYEYDAANRMTAQTMPDGRVARLAYDSNDNVITITPPSRPDHKFEFTPLDQRKSYNPPDVGLALNSTTYQYNKDRRPVSVTRPDGRIVNMVYDTAGRLDNIYSGSTGSLRVNYTYDDKTGHLNSAHTADGIMLSYEYDGALMTKEILAGPVNGSVSLVYDSFFRAQSLNVMADGNWLTSSINFTYDDDGLATQVGAISLTHDLQNGLLTGTTLGLVTDNYVYSRFGETFSYTAKYDGALLFDSRYERDAIGRIIKKTETIGGVATIYEYIYDTAGRLIQVKEGGVTVSSYDYDANGNRITAITRTGTYQGFYDLQDRMTKYGDATYNYTNNGELSSKTDSLGTTIYSYDVFGNLRSVTMPNGDLIEYVIDGRDRRIGKKVNGVLVQGLIYAGQLEPVAELEGAGNIVSTFVYASKGHVPDYMTKGGVTYRVISDHLGSVRLVINSADGSIAQRIDYDEYGNVTSDTNPGFQPFAFAGGLYDQHTKLIRFGARDYNAFTGRWTAKDPILFAGGDLNLYGYVMSDPVNELDIEGMDAVDDAANAAAGFGDELSMGLTEDVRRQLGIDCSINKNSESYKRLAWAGFFLGMIDTGLERGALSIGKKVLHHRIPKEIIRLLKDAGNVAGWDLRVIGKKGLPNRVEIDEAVHKLLHGIGEYNSNFKMAIKETGIDKINIDQLYKIRDRLMKQ
jgi:RHS repeat-associated protein